MFSAPLNKKPVSGLDVNEEEGIQLLEDKDIEVPEPEPKKLKIEDTSVQYGDLSLEGSTLAVKGMKPIECDSEDCAKHVLASLKMVDTEQKKNVTYVPDTKEKLNFSQKRKALERFRTAMRKSDRYNKSNGTFRLNDKLVIMDRDKKTLPDPSKRAPKPSDNIDDLRKEVSQLKKMLQEQKQSDSIYTNVQEETVAPVEVTPSTNQDGKINQDQYNFLKRYMGL